MQRLFTPFPEVLLLSARKFEDERGFFSEVYNEASLQEFGFFEKFIQDNHVHNAKAGTLRGLHYQLAPFAQDKLVRVVRGSIFDVAVDIREDSVTYGEWFGVELSRENTLQMLVPKGFAHGYLTLEDDTEVTYKVSNNYAPDSERGIAWNDASLGIDWPVTATAYLLSPKDLELPGLQDSVLPSAPTP